MADPYKKMAGVDPRFDMSFLNSIIINEEKTKEIST